MYKRQTYDYRIAVFGNDGIYPEEAVNFASSLNDELPNAVIEQIGIKIDCRPQGYNVYCVALAVSYTHLNPQERKVIKSGKYDKKGT